jgi:uncharacterized protein RhaS with RHS repeats
MQQRYYDPRVGRFWSVDPVTVDSAGGNFNRYWYANNNPYRFKDPDGRFGCTGTLIKSNCGGSRALLEGVRSVGPIGTLESASGTTQQRGSREFTIENANSRLAEASKRLDQIRRAVEGKSHKDFDEAAAYFGRILQPLAEEYGLEVFADINSMAQYRLEGVFVSDVVDDKGIGSGGVAAYAGFPTIHAHPYISESPPGLAPFSTPDVLWISATGKMRHYVSDSTGVWRFNGPAIPPTRVGP